MHTRYLAILKDRNVCFFCVLQTIPTLALLLEVWRNNTVSRLFSSRCEAANCTQPDFPKASLPFSAQRSAHSTLSAFWVFGSVKNLATRLRIKGTVLKIWHLLRCRSTYGQNMAITTKTYRRCS